MQSGGRRLQQSAAAGLPPNEYILAIPPTLQATMAATLSLQPVLPLPAGFEPPASLAGYDFVALPAGAAVAPPQGYAVVTDDGLRVLLPIGSGLAAPGHAASAGDFSLPAAAPGHADRAGNRNLPAAAPGHADSAGDRGGDQPALTPAGACAAPPRLHGLQNCACRCIAPHDGGPAFSPAGGPAAAAPADPATAIIGAVTTFLSAAPPPPAPPAPPVRTSV